MDLLSGAKKIHIYANWKSIYLSVSVGIYYFCAREEEALSPCPSFSTQSMFC